MGEGVIDQQSCNTIDKIWTTHRSEDIADQLLDIPNYTQPVVLLDSDGYAMSLDQQMQYMREMSGE